MSHLSIVLEKLAKFFRGYFFDTPGTYAHTACNLLVAFTRLSLMGTFQFIGRNCGGLLTS